MNNPNSKRMLVILAHPDDESFATGGTLAKYANQGVQVVHLCATKGEAGIPGKSFAETAAIREHELLQAAKSLGTEVHFLGYPDGKLANLPPEFILKTISSWMQRVQPQLIITFGPDGVSGHPDHVTISNIVTQAYDLTDQKGMLLYIHPSDATLLGCGVTSSDGNHERELVAVDISDFKFQKLDAMKSHVSQNPGLDGLPEDEINKIACSEIFSIARKAEILDNLPQWFETQEAFAEIE